MTVNEGANALLTDLYQLNMIQAYLDHGETRTAVFEFFVKDVQAEKRRLIAAGCVVIEQDPAVPRCSLRDPFGLVFNLSPPPAT